MKTKKAKKISWHYWLVKINNLGEGEKISKITGRILLRKLTSPLLPRQKVIPLTTKNWTDKS